MTNIRDKAQKILEVVPEGRIIKSNENPPSYVNDFYKFTGTSHLVLMANWVGGGRMTACNGFVNWYARQLGIKDISNWFELKKSLIAVNKQHAWVKSSANAPRPKYGDILKHAILHVDVAIGFNSNILHRVAAGQGDGSQYSMHPRPRPPELISREYDVLMRVQGKGPYNWQNLEGWLDIELYFGTGSQSGQVPSWLVGWWRVTWRGQTYYYYFGDNLEVRWTQDKPSSTTQPPISANDIGDFTLELFGVATRWRTTGSVEQFRSVYNANDQRMQGTWNGTEPIFAEKM